MKTKCKTVSFRCKLMVFTKRWCYCAKSRFFKNLSFGCQLHQVWVQTHAFRKPWFLAGCKPMFFENTMSFGYILMIFRSPEFWVKSQVFRKPLALGTNSRFFKKWVLGAKLMVFLRTMNFGCKIVVFRKPYVLVAKTWFGNHELSHFMQNNVSWKY